MKLISKIRLFYFLIVAAFAPYCKGSSQTSTGLKNSTGGTPTMATTSQYIDAQLGGTITLGSQMSLSIPAGALDKSTEISVSQVAPPAAKDGVNPLVAYSFEQHGLQFHIPATLKICYPGTAVSSQNLNEDSTAIYHDDDSNYASYSGVVDKTKHCVQTEINHFSTYFVAAQALLTINTPPLVNGFSTMPSTPMAGIPLKIRSVVTDFNGAGRGQVASVWLHYCVGLPTTSCGSGGTFTKVAMLPDTSSLVIANRYTYTVPANNVTLAGLTYFVEAIDNLRKPNNPVTQSRNITVAATGITIAPATLDIAAGFSRQFTVQAVPSTGTPVDIDFETVSVSNGIGNAAVNGLGQLIFQGTTSGNPLTTGFNTGTVTASVGSLSASSTVNVWPGQLTAIQLMDSAGVVLGSNITLAPNASFAFDARGLDAFGNFSLVYPAWIVTNPLVGGIPSNDGVFNASGNDGQSGQVLAIVDNIVGAVTVNIVAPPTVTLSVSGSPFSENGGIATVQADLSQAYASPVTVTLAFSGSAPGADYIVSSNTIIIPAGQLSGSITLTGVDNAIFDGSRTVIVDIASVVNGIESGVQQVTAIIQDDETAPFPIAATPLDGSTNNPVTTSVSVTFSQPMNPATLTTTTATSCTGSLQLSADDFVTCIAINAALAVMSNGNTTATFTPAAPLANNTLYKIRVTTAAQGANGAPLAMTVTSPSGWTTEAAVVTNQLNGSSGDNLYGSCIDSDNGYLIVRSASAHTIYKQVSGVWLQVFKILSAADANNVNPRACAISGNYVAIITLSTLSSSNEVRVYKNDGSDTFNQTATLTFVNPSSGLNAFLSSVDISGDKIIIGSNTYNAFAGVSMIYERIPATESWQLGQQLPGSTSGIGYDVAISGSIAVASAGGGGGGTAEIYEKDVNGVWQFTGSFGSFYGGVGYLDISDTGVIVGGVPSGFASGFNNAGFVLVVEKDQNGAWNTTASITSNDIESLDQFGAAAAIQGDTIVVGARAEAVDNTQPWADPLSGRGSVYTFKKDVNGVWQQMAKFEQLVGIPGDPDGRKADYLGSSVGISGTSVFGGAPYTINNGVPMAAQLGTVWIYPAP